MGANTEVADAESPAPGSGGGPAEPASKEEAPSAASTASSSTLPASRSGDSPEDEALCRQNIRMMFAFQLLSAISWGTAFGPVFDRFLYYLAGGAERGPTFVPSGQRNSLVGMSESISGLSSLFLAIPVGLLVDRHPGRRARLLKVAAVFGVASSVIGIVAVLTDYMLVMYAALIVLGVFSELSGSCTDAIFADSIPQGKRSQLFTTRSILSTVGVACGPLLSALGLELIGDSWQAYQMEVVVIAGMLIMPMSCVALLFFHDPPAARRAQAAADQGAAAEAGGLQATLVAEGAPAPAPAEAEQADPALPQVRCGPFRTRHVPILVALSDFVTCIGAGMTVKYFNLFFIEDMKFSPTQICWLQTAYPLGIAACMKFTQRLSKPFGRAQASLFFFSSNVLCLFLLSQVRSLPVLLFVFLLRGAFANSTYPIDRSIVMDFTPCEERGRWNAVQSLTSMTWSGSAFIGGILSDSHDYRFTFAITAIVYAAACVIYTPLLGLVPRREASSEEQAEAS